MLAKLRRELYPDASFLVAWSIYPEEPPWQLSESTFSLSSAFSTHALLLDLALFLADPRIRRAPTIIAAFRLLT
jgi:hypothetical protein